MGLVETKTGVAAPASVIDGEAKKDKEDKLVVLNKDEAKVVMKSKDFENFISKTSKIVERALNTTIDVVGAFFDDLDDDSNKASN